MVITDLEGNHEVKGFSDLEEILDRRDKNGFNSFWLSHGTRQYPTLCILVKNDLAALHFIPQEYVAGFRSQGNMGELNSGETAFVISKLGEQIWVTNEAIVDFSMALNAVREFFLSEELPKAMQWFEL